MTDAPSSQPVGDDMLAVESSDTDFLLRSLRDLEAEHDAGDLDDHDFQTLRDEYVVRAAQALRAESSGTQGASSSRLAPMARRRRVPRPVSLALVALLAVGLGVAVARFSGSRVTGQSVTGTIRPSAAAEMAEARTAMSEGRAVDAIKGFDRALAIEPDNVEALAYRGWLLHLAGMGDEALAWLDKALAVEPTYADAQFFRGVVLLRDLNRPADAAASLSSFLAGGSVPDELRARVESVRDEAAMAAGEDFTASGSSVATTAANSVSSSLDPAP